jgi:hypothetical protein
VKEILAVMLQKLSTTDSTYVVRKKNQSVMESTVVRKDTVHFLRQVTDASQMPTFTVVQLVTNGVKDKSNAS